MKRTAVRVCSTHDDDREVAGALDRRWPRGSTRRLRLFQERCAFKSRERLHTDSPRSRAGLGNYWRVGRCSARARTANRKTVAVSVARALMSELFVICSPATLRAGVPGAVVGRCHACADSIWISPSTRQWRGRSLLHVACYVCPPCALSHARRQPEEIEGFAVPAEQAEEMMRLVGQTGKQILESFGLKVDVI